MTDTTEKILAISFWAAVILLGIYIVYREFMLERVSAEKDEISLGEIKNEDLVNSQSDIDLVNAVNSELGAKPGNTPKKN